jgi:transcriptional regulator with XRE-family HTH domain
MAKRKPVEPTPAELAELDAGLLRAVRQRHGWSQRTLADLLGVHEITICRWEAGRRLSPWFRTLLAKLQEAKPQALPNDPVEAIAVLLASAYALDRPRPAPLPPPPPRRALPASSTAPAPPAEPTRFGLLETD